MRTLKLKELCLMKSGGTPSRKKPEFFNGSIPWAKISDLESSPDGFVYDTEEHITNDGLASINNRLFTSNTLFLAMYGSVGKTAISKVEMSTNQAILGINIKDEAELDLYYLQYWFKTIQQKLLNRAVGGTLQNISLTIVKDLEISLPPLEEQKKIAAILDAADDYRQKTKALIDKYDQLTQSLFLDMFGDPVTNPKGWEIKSFEEMVSDDCPLTYGIVQPGDEVSDGVPCVRPVDLIQQYVSVDNLKRIDLSISQRFKRTILKGGEILLSVRGSVGVISIADSSLAKSNVTRGIVPIWFDKNVSNKLFFYYLYKSLPIQRKLSELAKGATLIQLNLKDLRELNLIKPPLELQNQFAERVAQIEKQKQQAEASLLKAEELFNSLLQKAFKGELTN